jgi:hypothetical protein
MAHYAFLNDDNIVTEVIVGRDENDLADGVTSWEEYYGAFRNQKCLRTSYNTQAGQHNLGGIPFRGNYAGLGYIYHETLDAFIPPKPFESWILDETIYGWVAPIPMPDDGGQYFWDESEGDWVEVVSEAE